MYQVSRYGLNTFSILGMCRVCIFLHWESIELSSRLFFYYIKVSILDSFRLEVANKKTGSINSILSGCFDIVLSKYTKKHGK